MVLAILIIMVLVGLWFQRRSNDELVKQFGGLLVAAAVVLFIVARSRSIPLW